MTSRDTTVTESDPEVRYFTRSHLEVAVKGLCQVLGTFEPLQGCNSQEVAVM